MRPETLGQTLPLVTLVAVALLSISQPAAAQSRAARRPPTSALAAVVAGVEARRVTTPIIGARTAGGDLHVTFLAKRSGGRAPRIVSDATGWGERADGGFDVAAGRMTRLGTTEWYALETQVAPAARIEYLVAYGPTDYRPDPFNPRHALGRPGAKSEFVTPGYVPPPELVDPPETAAGQVTEGIIDSQALGASCRVIVYTPPGYRREDTYPLAVFHDGVRVVSIGEGPRVLDWLIARQAIEPLIAVFVDPGGQDGGHPASTAVGTFLGQEVVAWTASRYGVEAAAARRAVLAISYGAKDAVDVTIHSGDAFGRLGLLIPGRRLGPDDLAAIGAPRTHRLRVAILAGRYDTPNIGAALGARKAFTAAGDVVHYTEVPEGHNQATWRNHLAAVLTALFPPRPA